MTREPLDPAGAGASFDDAATPDAHAASLVVHGLLAFRALGDADAREGRVRRVMAALADDDGAGVPAPVSRWKFPRMIAAVAAALVLGFVALQLGLPTEKSALVQVQQSIDVMKSAGAQRYEVRVLNWDADARDDEPDTIDTRDGMVVVQHRPPWETEPLTVGRDETGLWGIGDDGAIVRGGDAARMWPPWAAIDGEVVLGQSIDGVLAAMVAAYTLHVSPSEEIERAGVPRVMNRISGTRLAPTGHQPNRIEVWIDPTSLVVERIEYLWDKEARDPPGGGAGGGGRPSGRELPPGPRPDGPDAGKPPRPPPGGPGGPGGPRGGGGGPPPGPRPGNPRKITFERVETPTLPSDWFDAAAHVPKK